MSSLQSFLDKISELKSEKIEGIALSTPDIISLEPLNLKQQKNIISNSLGGVKNSLLFTKTLNDVILECANNKDLLICDRIPLIIALRINSIGSKYGEINLEDILSNYKQYKLGFNLKEDIKYKTFKVELKLPTLAEENRYLTGIESLVKDDGEDAYNLGIIYTYELAKFVSKISIEDIELDISKLSVVEAVSVIEKLPLSLTKLIVGFIEGYKTEESKLSTVGDVLFGVNVDFFDIE